MTAYIWPPDYFIFFDDDSSLRELLEKQIEEDNKKN